MNECLRDTKPQVIFYLPDCLHDVKCRPVFLATWQANLVILIKIVIQSFGLRFIFVYVCKAQPLNEHTTCLLFSLFSK